MPEYYYDPSTGGVIASAANQYGVDPAYLSRVAQIESANNPNATSSTGAKGLFQFTGGTAKAYGLTDPTDPTQSANAAARLTADNQAALTKALGRAPTNSELYLAHQQGAAGAAALITHPNESAVDALTPVYGGNATRAAQAVNVNGGSPDMTAGAFTDQWAAKFNQPTATTQPAQPSPGQASDPLSIAPPDAATNNAASTASTRTAAQNFNIATGLGSKIGSAITSPVSAPSLMQLSDAPIQTIPMPQMPGLG